MEHNNLRIVAITAIMASLSTSFVNGIWQYFDNRITAVPNVQYDVSVLKREIMELKELVNQLVRDRKEELRQSVDDDQEFQSSVLSKLEKISDQLADVRSETKVNHARLDGHDREIAALDKRLNRHANQKSHWSEAERSPVPDAP